MIMIYKVFTWGKYVIKFFTCVYVHDIIWIYEVNCYNYTVLYLNELKPFSNN